MRDLPDRPDMAQLRRHARELLRDAVRGDVEASQRLAAVSARRTLTGARLAVAREHGFSSWARLKVEVERRLVRPTVEARDDFDIRPVATLTELADTFDVAGGQLVPSISHADRRFQELAERFPEDHPIMLVAKYHDRIIGGALAFRKGRKGGLGATLRIIGLEPDARGRGVGRRLMQTLELEATRLGIVAINLGGAGGDIKGFYVRLGYTGRGPMMSKALPLPGRFLEARLRKLAMGGRGNGIRRADRVGSDRQASASTAWRYLVGDTA